MTKSELIIEIAQRTGIDRQEVSVVVEATMKIIKNSLAEQKSIYMRGFGTFYAKKRKQKIGQIISRKQQVIIPEHYIPAFKAGKTFSDKVKSAYQKND